MKPPIPDILYNGHFFTTDNFKLRTPPNNGYIFSSQRPFISRNKPPYSGHLSANDNNIFPTGVRYMEGLMYTWRLIPLRFYFLHQITLHVTLIALKTKNNFLSKNKRFWFNIWLSLTKIQLTKDYDGPFSLQKGMRDFVETKGFQKEFREINRIEGEMMF